VSEICQIGIPPDPAFKTTLETVDWALLVVLLMGMVVLVYIGSQVGSNARRWFGPQGAVIALTLLCLPAAFAVAMARFLLFPSSEALKHWLNVQEALNPASCGDAREAAYIRASDSLHWYHTLLFFIPAFVGGLGLFILCWRPQPRPAPEKKWG
jgi:hypothetical protein